MPDDKNDDQETELTPEQQRLIREAIEQTGEYLETADEEEVEPALDALGKYIEKVRA